ncbi:MAG: TonB-dependent receptor [Azospira oryzae]|nr:MAG: TonB-dependent receptor [Azospira oryzae]
MRKIFTLLMLTMAAQMTWAQAQEGTGKISGSIIDTETKKPVEFATVALEDTKTNKPVNGSLADDKGKFEIGKVANGTYKVVISFMGYNNIEINDVVISDDKKNIDLGSQKMSATVTQLKEVVVQGQRDLVEEKVDRLVYNAENDNTTKGGDGTDVLRRVPMLTVDMDGNVSLRGNQNLRVLINGKPSAVAATSVSDALKQIPADEIKSVEVITSPSAKYDAEGSGGIINIITKKSNLQGYSLGVDGSVGFRGANLGLNGSLRTGKMGFSLGGFGRSNYNVTGKFNNSQENLQSNQTTTQQASTLNRGLFGNYNLGWDYDINKFNSLTANVRLGARNGRNFQDDLLSSTVDANGNLLTNSARNVDVKDNSENVDASLTYTKTFETTGKELSFMGSYNRNNRVNNSINETYLQNDVDVENGFRNDNKSYNQEITIQADYQTPLAKKHILEFGAKNIMRSVSSKYNYLYSTNGSEYTESADNNQNNSFDYTQNVTAGYAAFTFSLPKSYTLKAGSRYEYTTIDAKFASEGDEVKIPSYGVLVPSINISKKLSNGNTLKAAYNRRIQRPSLQYLNPNPQSSNNAFVTVGNPTLSPEYTNNYELSYSTFIKTTSLNFSAFVRNTTKAIQSVKDYTEFNGYQNVLRTQYFNIGNEDAYGGSLFANINVSNKFTLNGGTDVYYAVLKNNNPNPDYNASNEGFVYNVRMFGNYNFAPLYGFQFFGFYRGRQVQLQGVQGGFAMYSFSLKRDFSNKKGSVGLGVENFLNFNGWKVKNETQSLQVNQSSVNVMNNLSFKVNFSYRIGKLGFDQPKRRKSINNDDMKGDGGDGGGMDNGGGMQQGGGRSGAAMGGNRPGAATVNTKVAAVDPAAVVNAEGTWTYTLDSPQGGAGKIVIRKEGDKFTGTITNNRSSKETPLSSVTLNGNEITMAYEVSFGGNTMNVSVKGTITGDELNGNMSVGQFGSFPINGKREVVAK